MNKNFPILFVITFICVSLSLIDNASGVCRLGPDITEGSRLYNIAPSNDGCKFFNIKNNNANSKTFLYLYNQEQLCQNNVRIYLFDNKNYNIIHDFCNKSTNRNYALPYYFGDQRETTCLVSNLFSLLLTLYYELIPVGPTTLAQTTATVRPATTAQTNPITSIPSTSSASLSCGVANSPDDLGVRIVNGQIVIENSWPWQVLLDVESNGANYLCGASIISRRYILTAGHCVEDADRIRAYVGVHNRNLLNNPTVQQFIIEGVNIKLHEQYSTGADFNDIALLKTSTDIQFSNKINSICLNTGADLEEIGQEAIVTGWGVTEVGATSNLLRAVDVKINDGQVCSRNGVTDKEICAGNTAQEKDSCQGDSGGPLFARRGDIWYQIGIVSYGEGCGGKGVYMKVSKYYDWIQTNMV